ncbi:MAG: hypothetical protein HY559_04315 [Gammaproteobacteria bacterium]|nr:hypothetical protein [Gammaproteobacteria bacterium]
MNSPTTNYQPLTTASGFFTLTLVVLIIIMALVGTVTAYLFTTGSRSATHRLLSTQAFYIAEAGLERAVFALLSPHVTSTDALTKRYSCSTAAFSNQAFGEGVFTVTNAGTNDSVASLTTALTSTAVIIPVSTLSGLSAQGRVLIDQESMDYAATSTSVSVCGTQPCLTGVVRGQDSTLASTHASGAAVAQYQCTGVQSTGGVPDLTSPVGKRIVKRGGVQLQKAWAVGNDIVGATDPGELTAFWDGVSWVRQGPSGSIPNVDINAIDMLSYGDGWAVGDPAEANALFLRWDGTNWNRVIATAVPSVILNSVHCVTGSDCWAVGVTSAGGEVIDHWDGTSWTRSGPFSTVPNVVLNDVYCVSSTDCWTVGGVIIGQGTIAHWTGSTWTTSGFTNNLPTPPVGLNSVACVSSSDCWTVGGLGTVARFDGSSWNEHTDLGNDILKSVYCIEANDCWIVGDSRTFAHWDGNAWSTVSAPSVPNTDYNGVSCYTSRDCWAVGQKGTFVHWDGSNWTQVSTPIPTGVNDILNGIDTVGSKGGLPASIWQEDFH